MKKSIKVLLIILSILISIPICYFFLMCIFFLFVFASGGCGDEIIQTKKLNSDYTLKLHEINCGATTDFSYNLEIKKKGGSSLDILGFEIKSGAPTIDAIWKDDKHLKIIYSPSTVVNYKETKYKDIQIEFTPLGGKILVPERYTDQIKFTDLWVVSIFLNDINIYWEELIPGSQTGYAFNENGKRYTNWNKNWLVVGNISYTVPLFIDKREENMNIYVGKKVEGKWEKEKIATSYRDFQNKLKVINKLSKGREFGYPKENPISKKKINNAMQQIDNGDIVAAFWIDLLEGESLADKYVPE